MPSFHLTRLFPELGSLSEVEAAVEDEDAVMLDERGSQTSENIDTRNLRKVQKVLALIVLGTTALT